MSDQLTYENFSEHAGTTFNIRITDELAVDAILKEVTEPLRRRKGESFSIVFLLPPDTPQVQQVCQVGHPAMGDFELFLVAVESTAEGTDFEAVFNRMLPAE